MALAKLNQHPTVLKTNKLHSSQIAAFFSMAVFYLCYSFALYNIGPATKIIQDESGISSTQFGLIFTIFYLVYAVGNFISGFLSDRYSTKVMMFIGALGCVAANILFGLSDTFYLFILFWSLNAFFFSMGWAPGCGIIFKWFPEHRRGLFMGIYAAMSYLGGAIVYPLAGYCISIWGWRSAFYVSAAILLLWSLIFLLYSKDSPKQAGMLTEWEADKDVLNKVDLREYRRVLTNPMINLVCFTMTCAQFVRWGLLNWMIKILIEPVSTGGYGMNVLTAVKIASLLHWGGAFFSIVLGMISDRIFKGTRWQSVLLGFLLTTVALLVLMGFGNEILANDGGLVILGLILFICGGAIQGIQAPLYNLPGDILGPKLGSTGTGLITGWSYIGASLSGVLLGWILDTYSFTGVIVVLAGISLIGAFSSFLIRR